MHLIRTLVSALFLTIYFSAQADCSSRGLWAYPANGKLTENGWIMLEAYGRSQEIMDSLNKRFPIFLRCDDHEVPLVIEEISRGQFHLTQALLRPAVKLVAGKTYSLVIDQRQGDHAGQLFHRNSLTKEYEDIQWKVIKAEAEKRPEWISRPLFQETFLEWYGCGPAVYAIFEPGTPKGFSGWIKTELVDVETNEQHTYYLRPNAQDGLLYIGHGMCSGAFNFKTDHHYKVRFTLLATNGTPSESCSRWTTFDSPFQSSSEGIGN